MTYQYVTAPDRFDYNAKKHRQDAKAKKCEMQQKTCLLSSSWSVAPRRYFCVMRWYCAVVCVSRGEGAFWKEEECWGKGDGKCVVVMCILFINHSREEREEDDFAISTIASTPYPKPILSKKSNSIHTGNSYHASYIKSNAAIPTE